MPPLVMNFVMPPTVRPYCASMAPAMTRISFTRSGEKMSSLPGPPRCVLSTPSIMKALRCIPPKAKVGLPNSSSRVPFSPGTRSARLNVLREVSGAFSIERWFSPSETS